MLRREDLGRRHQRRLIAVLNRDERGLHGDDGLAGADVSLQQTPHWTWLAHVFCDFAENTLLRRRRMEGKHLLDRLADGRVRGKRGSFPLAQTSTLQLQSEFQVKELLKDQPSVRRSSRGHQLRHRCSSLRKMHRLQRCQPCRKLQALAKRSRKRLLNRIDLSLTRRVADLLLF